MKIHRSWIEEWLVLFHIEGTVKDTLEFLHKDDKIDGERQIRIIIGVETENQVLVFKLVHESMFPPSLIESQILFSQNLRAAGINTTRQYKTSEGYVQEVMLEGLQFVLTCEAFIGSEPQELTPDLAFEIGKTIGKMHLVSEKAQLEIGFSRVYHEVMRKSSYKKIWLNQCTDWVDAEWLERVSKKHDQLMEEIYEKWESLPKAAVQGDVFGLNNVAETEEGLAIYDYNLASDEVLVGDFLLVWYRTIADQSMHCFLNEENADLFWHAYAAGYLESRPLSEAEYEVGYKLCAVLGVLHLSKLALEIYAVGHLEDAKQCLKAAERILNHPRWIDVRRKQE